MTASELKIGNLLRCGLTKSFLKVVEIKEDGFITLVIDRSKFPLPKGWFTEPIPITEEILLKCGFDGTEYNDYRHPVLIGTLTIYEGIAELHLSDMYSVWVNNLHQLQNLFYAITGKELEVKL